MKKIDYEIQFIKDELKDRNFTELSDEYLEIWLLALEWAKDNWDVNV